MIEASAHGVKLEQVSVYMEMCSIGFHSRLMNENFLDDHKNAHEAGMEFHYAWLLI